MTDERLAEIRQLLGVYVKYAAWKDEVDRAAEELLAEVDRLRAESAKLRELSTECMREENAQMLRGLPAREVPI